LITVNKYLIFFAVGSIERQHFINYCFLGIAIAVFDFDVDVSRRTQSQYDIIGHGAVVAIGIDPLVFDIDAQSVEAFDFGKIGCASGGGDKDKRILIA